MGIYGIVVLGLLVCGKKQSRILGMRIFAGIFDFFDGGGSI